MPAQVSLLKLESVVVVGNGDDFDGFLDAIRAGGEVWNSAKDRGVIDAIKEFFNRPEPIVVLGSTGCGKTNFLYSLAESAGLTAPIPREERTEQVERFRVKIANRSFSLIDTPGQSVHYHLRGQVIRELLPAAPIRIVNVVSYGYHEYKSNQVSDAVDTNGIPRSDYLDRHRVDELAALGEWLPLLGDRSVSEWILTVVTKADLWWNDRHSVANYYESGPYADMIGSADSRLHHVVRPYCSVVHRFFGASILPGTFDDVERINVNDSMLRQIAKLTELDK